MRPLTLSQRLFLVTAVALLPAVGILSSSILVSRAENERAVHLQAVRTSEQASLEMERVISGAENVLRALSVTPIVRQGDLEICSGLVTGMASTVPSLSAISVINPDGNIRCGPIGARPLPNIGDRQYFIDALATEDRIVGTFIIERATGNRVLPIALRIGGTGEAPLGVAVAYIDLDWLQARLEERTFVPGSSLTIADRNGIILARVPEPERYVGTEIPETFRYLLTMPQPGSLELTSQDGTRRVVGYIPATDRAQGLYVSAGFATEAAFASTEAIFSRGVMIGLAGIIAALVLATYTSKAYIARPVQTLVDTIEAWRAGKTDARTGMSAKDGEVGNAGQAFDAFIEELLAAREARQQAENHRQVLLGELDHRGKNLLTLIQAVARRTFSRFAAEPELQIFSDRLRAIGDANGLLRQEHWQSASLAGLVKSALAPFIDVSMGRIEVSGPQVFLQADAVLPFSMALHELGTNAMKYGALRNEVGKVSISWTLAPHSEGYRVDLVWQENGGPPVIGPSKRGFGSTVIEQVLSSHTVGDVELDYEHTGLVCRMTLLAERVSEPSGRDESRIAAAGLTGMSEGGVAVAERCGKLGMSTTSS